MASSLDMSLDDLIKNNRQSFRGRGRGGRGGFRRGGFRGGGGGGFRGGRGGRGGAMRRGGGRIRPSPYTIAKSFNQSRGAIWGDMFENGIGAGGMQYGIETGTKLYISNLDYGVSNDDMKQLFSEVGELKRCSIHYDRSGRSKGTAEVVFARRNDALSAIQRYNAVQLDGKPMKIELVGTSLNFPIIGNNFTGTSAGFSRIAMTPGFTQAVGAAPMKRRGGGG